MKDLYVILAFHAHELLWDLPERLLSSLEDGNPMKETILDANYIKKREEEGRDLYTLGIQLGEKLQAPICVEYSNELLQQIHEFVPEIFERIKSAFQSGRLYPIYGHAHHTHVSLLKEMEISQEIIWNMQYLHEYMAVPPPKYKGCFSPEASYSADKLGGITAANIDYVIFPHLQKKKAPFELSGPGDHLYKPFWLSSPHRCLLAFPRNFPISQEIWRPITRMKRDEVKNQGYKLGDYPVFFNEYLSGQREPFPIEMEEGVALYREVLRQELNQAPPDGVLLYIQDLELMDFGDTAIEIIARAWQTLLAEDREIYRVHFVTPEEYIDRILKVEGFEQLPEVKFRQICWAPEIRLVLRADGHYPPLGVEGGERYSTEKSGLYRNPLIFWENGKYFCGICDTLVENFRITENIPVQAVRLSETGYDLAREDLDTQIVLYRRLMKRACNWGWRPTEGRQKRPCLDGYLLCAALLKKIDRCPDLFILCRELKPLDSRDIAGLIETLKVFVDNRISYLRFGLEKYMAEHGGEFSEVYRFFEETVRWKEVAVQKAAELYQVNSGQNMTAITRMKQLLSLMQEYCQALFMATEYLQKIWGELPDVEFMVDRMYEYLYELYPPLFPEMINRIDAMSREELKRYFDALKADAVSEPPFAQITP
ncbi:MAG: glycoside hydrolase [Firmicutes bacterium]|nr:glycoside hydrolase [Bacillota bacterium]